MRLLLAERQLVELEYNTSKINGNLSMAVPRNRHSNARKNSKRAHHAKTPKNLSKCKECGASKMPHVVCGQCGTYAGRTIIQKTAE